MIQRKYIEVNLLTHCTLRCTNCAVASPHLKPAIYPLDDFKKDIAALSDVFHVEDIRFLGGEPFMVKNIREYVDFVRESHISDKVTISTNGTLLEDKSDDLLRSFDEIHISLYNDVSERIKEKVERGWKRAALLADVTYEYWTHFRFTEFVGKVEDVSSIWENCSQPTTCNSLYNGFVFLCSQGRFRGEFLQSQGFIGAEHLLDPNVDGCAIHAPNLEQRLDAYLNRSHPLEACSYCMGNSGEWTPRSQVQKMHVPIYGYKGSSV